MLDRTVAPSASEISRPAFPQADTILLNGIETTVLNQSTQPVTLLEMIIPVGRWQEPAPGITYFIFKMLTEGTSGKSSSEIASVFDYYGSHLEVVPTLDHVSIKLYALNKFLPHILPVFTELFMDSSFPKHEFETLKQIRLQQIKQQHARNNAFASLKFREMLFGAEHPYGEIIMPEMVEQVSLEQVIQFKSALLVQPKVFITGMIDQSVISAIENALGRISFNDPLPKQKIAVDGKNKAAITRENSTQASIRLGRITVDRQHPDAHKIKVANTLFGGFFGSRLMKNIREEKGLTYGIHSSVMHLDDSSYWYISSEVLQDKVDIAKEEIYKEIQRLKMKEPSKKEFEMVKNYMKGKYLGSFDSPFSSHEMIKSLKLGGLPENYFINFLDTLDHITPAEVNETVSQYFSGELTELEVY